ncbi:OmpA family protein [Streptomyces sp. NPDC001922]|uniref:OmpA family protein n=1 Tax=Streptomyces sp. NPDC001922 TaxID=3364624 RepID=UPI0036B77709
MTRPRRPRPAAALALGACAVAALTLVPAPHAVADDPPGLPGPAAPPVRVDADDPGLKMVNGATLAPAKVLDITSVVESEGGEERREDTNRSVTFALQAEVLFGKDSAKIGDGARSRIREIADEIEKQDAPNVRVFGFTDNLGSSAHGDVLSKKRADAVQRVLAGLLGSDVTYEIRGYGEDYPIAGNDDEEGRKKNRRVEVSFPRAEPGGGG